MHGDLVLRTAAAIHAVQARRALPRAARHAADARQLRGGDLPPRPRQAAAHAALRARGRRAARGRRRARRSGTATLEAALARCPHVIFYRLSRITAEIVRRKLLLPWVGLPNVLARPLRRAGVPAGRGHAGEPRAGRAQSLRRHGDAAPAGGAVRRLRGLARRRHRRARGRGGGARAARGAACAC